MLLELELELTFLITNLLASKIPATRFVLAVNTSRQYKSEQQYTISCSSTQKDKHNKYDQQHNISSNIITINLTVM
jgi:hypothetical protein